MKCLVFFLLLFSGLVTKAQQTYSISGTVTDEKGMSVPDATVFLTKTQNVTATNVNGQFVLNRLTPGNYVLVINMIGFETYSQNIKVQEKDITINAGLKENNNLLKEVSIKSARPKINKRYLDWFTKAFIGSDANARQCKILNPEVLNFSRPTGQYELVATADSFLVIENDALGYKIKYLLKKCVYYMESDISYYDGSSYFEELKGTPEQQKIWEENRRKAYLGSRLHFLRAVMNNQSRAEGFFTYMIDYAGMFKGRSNLIPIDVDTLFKATGNNSKRLISRPSRTKRPEFYVYYALASDRDASLTWLVQCADTVTIDKNGSIAPDGNEFSDNLSNFSTMKRGLSPGVAFSFCCRWANQRVADLTPLNYTTEIKPDSLFLKPVAVTDSLKTNPTIKKLRDILLRFDVYSLLGSSTTADNIKSKVSAN